MASGWRSSYYRYKQLFLNVSATYKKRSDLRAFLEIVLSLIAVIIFVVFALKPTALTIISLVQQIKEEKKVLTSLNQKVSDLQKASTLLTQNQMFLDNINLAISTTPSPDIFAKQILGMSAKNNVELMALSINEVVIIGNTKKIVSKETEPLPENANEIGYSISIKGGFANINTFLKDIENLRTISKIDSLTISSSISDSGRVIVAVISGRIPYLEQVKK